MSQDLIETSEKLTPKNSLIFMTQNLIETVDAETSMERC